VLDEGSPGGLPAFLRVDAPQSTAAPVVPPVTPVVLSAPSSFSTLEAERQRRRDLAEELSAVSQQLADATTRVEVLQGDNHAAAEEVRELEATLASLRTQEAEAHKRKAERDAQVQREALAESATAAMHADVDVEVGAYRAECQQRFEETLRAVTADAEAQEEENVALRKACESAMSTTPEARCQTIAFDALQRRLQDGARHLKQHFSQQCSDVVSHSVRLFLNAARQQRSEVLTNDAARRAEQLHHYQAEREKSMAAFYEDCHGVFEERTDSLFGALKISMEKRRRQVEYERHQRLGAFHGRLHAMTERGRVALEHQLRTRREQELVVSTAQRESAIKELALRQSELAQQRRTFQSRAEAEYQSLREAHGGVTGNTAVKPPSFAQKSSAAMLSTSLESLRREMEEVQTKLNQVGLTLRTRRQSAVRVFSVDQSMQQADSLRPPFGNPTLDVERALSQWRDALLPLQQQRELLRKTIAELTASTRSWSNGLQRGRQQLAEQRESAHAVRRSWEAEVRGQLSRCLTVQNPDVPALASLTTAALENLNVRLGNLTRQQSALRSSRGAFAAQMAAWVESVREHRSRTEGLLTDVFYSFEALREKSTQAEVDALTLRSVRAQVDVLHRHVSQEACRLATQKRQLDDLLEETLGGKPVALLPSATASDPLSHRQSTRVFSSVASPLGDITNASQNLPTRHPSPEPPSPNTSKKKAAQSLPPSCKEPTTAARQQRLEAHPPFATTRSLTVTTSEGGVHGVGRGGARGSHGGGRAAATTVSASTTADLFGSDSPSPIMPSLEGHSGWLQQSSGGGGTSSAGGGTAFAAGAHISVFPQSEDTPGHGAAAEDRHGCSVDYTEADFTTDLEPLDDDDEDDSEVAPLR
jgi:hypothetical protein